MVSKKLVRLFSLALLLIAAHGVEEYVSGFLYQDRFVWYFSSLANTKEELFYWTFHIMWWALLLIVYALILGKRWSLYIMALFALVFPFELHHVIKSIIAGKYYPGMITGILYPLLGFFYWKEVLKNWRMYDKN